VSRGKNLRKCKVCYGHQVFQQPKEEKLRKQDLLEFKLQETENIMTTLQSNIHYNTVTIIHVNPSIMNIQYQKHNKMSKKVDLD
jgi:hypothetical protein